MKSRIKSGELVVIKTDKSGKLGVISKEKYLQMGLKDSSRDMKIDRKQLKRIEKEINDHTRMLLKVVNAGEAHGHLDRITKSKITNSETETPKYFLFKDHKENESWRPVVSGCNSNTLGLSNLLSDIVESVCSSVSNPYEVISSEDLLARIELFNDKVAIKRKLHGPEWDWRQHWTMIGSDVVSLFPSLTAENTASDISFENIDTRWLTMYIHQNRDMASDITSIKHLLPVRRKGKRGPEPGMSSTECMKRHLEDVYENGDISSWIWPQNPTRLETKELMSIMEIAVKFFFGNFVYTFDGEMFLQSTSGPIGAHLTMCIA